MLSIITSDDSTKWDSIVKSFNNYDVYYLYGYAKAFKLHGDGEPILFYYYDEGIRAINVVMKRDIENNKNFRGKIDRQCLFDIATPYGYGGFLIEGKINVKSLKRLNEEYSTYCNSNNIISEFVRFHPVLENSKISRSIYEVADIGNTVTIDLVSKEQIWECLTSKNRNIIRKAIKSGVKIFWGRTPELYEYFILMYNETMDKNDAADYYYFDKNFYNSILMDLKYNSLLFYAVYENKIISMGVILFANKQMHYHLSALNKAYGSVAPMNLLLFEAACWGCENGFKTFHLGGGLGGQEDNLFKFKKSFNKNSYTIFSIGKKIFDKEKYDSLVEIRKKESDFDAMLPYFPLYSQ